MPNWPSLRRRHEPRALTPAERRQHARFACAPEASVRLQPGVPARLLNLGRGGVLVESSARLVPGSMTTVVFGSTSVAFPVRARIKRVFVAGVRGPAPDQAPLRYRAGLEFGQLSATQAGEIEAFVSGVARAPDRQVFIRFPRGWALKTRKYAVVAEASQARSYVMLGTSPRPPDRDLGEFARVSMQAAGFSPLLCQPADLNGLSACLGFYTGTLGDLGAVLVEAAHVVLRNQTYLIAGVAPLAAYETVRHDFFATISSFGGEPAAEGACLVAPPPLEAAAKFAGAPLLPVGARRLPASHRSVIWHPSSDARGVA